MKHWRRKRLLAAINDMYLQNLKRTNSYTEISVLERNMATVSDKLRAQVDAEDALKAELLQRTQLNLFA